jgi:N-acylneuraminate cytidylyltransferase
MEKTDCIAIIPARGGSKGIPKKNIVLTSGKPLIAWTIEAALAAKTINRIIVSTDDADIAKTATIFGAEVIMRPASISGDKASSEAALLHVLSELKNHLPKITVFLQCTSPLMTSDDIDGTVNLIKSGQFDCAFTAIPFYHFLWTQTGAGSYAGINHDSSFRPMRQDRQEQLLEVGAVYAMDTEKFMEKSYRFFGRIGTHMIHPDHALEIDDPADLERAEFLINKRQSKLFINDHLKEKLSSVKLIATDFDGVLTDNKAHVSQIGEETVVCSRSDGHAANLFRSIGISLVCISTESNPVVAKRCEKMGIDYYHGQVDKVECLKNYLRDKAIDKENCLYVGNDSNDAGALSYAGISAVPADVYKEVEHLAQIKTATRGGDGVLRELFSIIQEAKNRSKKRGIT